MNLRDFLRAQGASEAEIAQAEGQGPQGLRMLAVDRFLLGGVKRYTPVEVAKLAGVDHEVANRYWRALGFVDVPDDEVAFTDMDVAALQGAIALIDQGYAKPLATMQLARVMGQAMARVANAQLMIMGDRIAEATRSADMTDDEIAAEIMTLSSTLVPINEQFLNYVYRRHTADAAKRSILFDAEAGTGELSVGFCDLVGFTAMARRMEEEELGALVETFESTAYDTINAHGGRLVKMIGDEVMFVADRPADAAEIALLLSEAHTRDKSLPDVRVGLAYGPALAREGDYYGDTVNLANRTAAVALPSTILVTETMATALEGEEAFELKRIRNRYLKGIGRVRLWALGRAVV